MKIKFGFLAILIVVFYFSLDTHGSSISNIGFSFCEDTQKDKIINIQAGGSQELCLNFFSKLSEEIYIQYGFSKGFIKNSNGLQLCDKDMGPENEFSKLFSNKNGNNRNLIIPPQGFVTVHETIKAPIGINGMIYGCLVFKTSKTEDTNVGGMFNIIERKTENLKLLVGSAADIKSSIEVVSNKSNHYSSNKKIKVEIKNKDSKISFLLRNNGNITQEVKIEGRFFNVLGFDKKIKTPSYILAPGTTTEIESKIGIIPAYKGPFKVTFKINALPYIDFEGENIDQKLKTPIIIQETGQIFIFSRIWLILLFIIIGIVIITFKPLFKNH